MLKEAYSILNYTTEETVPATVNVSERSTFSEVIPNHSNVL